MIELNHRYTHKFKSQFLSIDEIDSDWGTDLELHQDEFAKKLDNPERMSHENLKQTSWPARNRINGLIMLEGLLKIDGYSEGKYEAYLGAGLYEFGKLVEGKLLSDIDLGGERTWQTKSNWQYPADDFCLFPVLNTGFYGDDENIQGPLADQFMSQNYGYQNYYEMGTGVLQTTQNATSVISPFPFIGYLLKQIFKHVNYSITENEFDENPQLVKKCLYTNNSIIKLNYTLTQQVWFFQAPTRELNTWEINKIIPEIDILDFLIGLQNDLNITFEFNPRNREVKILDREKRMNMSPSRLLLDKIVPKSTSLKLSKDKLGIEMVPDFDTNDEYFTENNSWAEIKDDDFIKKTVATVDDLPEPGEADEIRFVESQDTYYKWTEIEETDDDGNVTNTFWDWRGYARNQQKMKIGNSDYEKIESIFCPTYHIGFIQRGNNPMWMVTSNYYDCKPKMLNYYGPLGDPAIPRGDADGSTENNGISNDLRQGQNPRYVTRWQSTGRFFISRQEGSFTMELTPAELRDIDTTIPYLHPEGFSFFLDEGTCELFEGIDTAEVKTKFYAFN